MAFNIIFCFMIGFLPGITMATEHWVGGEKGWTFDVDYQAWAKDKTFKVGDKLVFKYPQGSHNVFKVNQTSFKECIVPPNGGLTSGHDVITLATPGKHWYICGFPTHCSDYSQKLVINVEDGAPAPAPVAPAPAMVYWVGGEKGWTIDVDYQAWTKGKTFKVGDKLVFKYNKGHHNVYKVNQTSFKECIVPPNGGLTSGHDVITLATPGKHWYICGFPTHCSDHSQKLVINVEGGAPAPAPVAPAPAPAQPMVYWVGGEKGWSIDVDYQAWAKGKTFKVGDKLVFKYTKGHHNVFKVNQTSFKECIVPPSGGLTSGHDVITLATPGKHWYICGFPTHCSDHSQKLVINVEGGAPAPAPVAPAPAPAQPKVYWVGGEKGWSIDVDYQAWVKGKTFKVGDKLVFKYTKGHHNVFKVNQTSFKDCIIPSSGGLTSGRDVITLSTPGKHWYICGFPTHCSDHNQKLVINVEGQAPSPATPVPAPAPAPPPTDDSSNSYRVTISAYKIFVGGLVLVWTILTLV